jgi:hypothetical protein
MKEQGVGGSVALSEISPCKNVNLSSQSGRSKYVHFRAELFIIALK